MSESNENSNDSSSRSCSSVQSGRIINSSRLNFIRPSVLGSNLNTAALPEEEKSEETLTANPFVREDNTLDTSGSGTAAGVSNDGDSTKAEEVDDKLDPLTLLNKNGLPKSNLFAQVAKAGSGSGFVFGQNVHERVVGDNLTPSSNDEGEKSSDNVSSMFAKVAEGASTTKEPDGKSLDEAAKEYEESRSAQKRKYDEVETFTGEEDETNIVDISCKLFAFVNCNWEERGRGSLRLNDSKGDNEKSRVVFRTCGNLRLVVNTKVWSKMLCDRSSQKSLRFTAIDSTGQVKIWLIMARPTEIQTLYDALHKRVEVQKNLHPEDENNQNGNSNTSEILENPKCSEEDEEPVAKKPITDEDSSAAVEPESA
ncbi:RANBP3 family protein [Megaselia abdita]